MGGVVAASSVRGSGFSNPRERSLYEFGALALVARLNRFATFSVCKALRFFSHGHRLGNDGYGAYSAGNPHD
jgi:hypothetical protein